MHAMTTELYFLQPLSQLESKAQSCGELERPVAKGKERNVQLADLNYL